MSAVVVRWSVLGFVASLDGKSLGPPARTAAEALDLAAAALARRRDAVAKSDGGHDG